MFRFAIFAAMASSIALAAPQAPLNNGAVVAGFTERGMASLRDNATGALYNFQREDFSLSLGGHTYRSAELPAPASTRDANRVTFTWEAGPYRIAVIYEAQPGWRFLSKQIVVLSGPAGHFRLDSFTPFQTTLQEPPRDMYVYMRAREDTGTKGYGGFLRFNGKRGLIAMAQNPYVVIARDGLNLDVSFQPDMDWDLAWGPFAADRGILAPVTLTGRIQPERMLPEWVTGGNASAPGLDEGEVAAFTDVVRAFLLYKPQKPLNIMVGWCVNDYQIDVATPQGQAEYKRILDMAAELGANHVLYAPNNSALARREDNTDDWGWEYVLWLGLGQKIRANQWNPATGVIPASVQEMLDAARDRNLKLVGYMYPVMGFAQNPEWLEPPRGTRSNVGLRSLQDWMIGALEGFMHHTGISGFSFDHVYLGYPKSSKYAQWWGWKRIMETLRRDMPDAVIDGRQAYQLYGPWTWLAGSYPHPTGTDEQPESFLSFPDLKLDRVSADRERYTAYRYRNYEFTPSEIVPGFITHQTSRSNDTGRMPEENVKGVRRLLPFHQRDWDYLGWRYSLLSSIAVAGWNNVIDMIPARDEQEFRNFSSADKHWFRHWIDWTNDNKEYLRHTRTILGQPALGKIDGTSAILGDRGYIFLFNPNGRLTDASIALDESVGLAGRGPFVVREVYPLEGRVLGKPGAGFWQAGDKLPVALDGGSALVLQIEPATGSSGPVLFNSPGAAALTGGDLRLTGVRGEKGTSADLLIAVAPGSRVTSVSVNGKSAMFTRSSTGLVAAKVNFAGAPFRHYQQVGEYDPEFRGGRFSGKFQIPTRVFDQLAAREKAWPIEWTSEDYRSTWLAPHRLLLFVQLAEPDDQWNAYLRIDGRSVPLQKAYASVRVNRRNFVGFYADVSLLAADRSHNLELELPASLKKGQFQGVFFENVETEYTADIR
jgi:hypothetical protein